MLETLVNILNIFWYIFSILFVLYKFTSFFSHLYNFICFCKKIIDGLVYIGSVTFPPRNYDRMDEESPRVNINSTVKTPFQNIKETFQNLYESENLNEHEMTESYIDSEQSHPLQKLEKKKFSKNLNKVLSKPQNTAGLYASSKHFQSKGNWTNKEGINDDDVISIVNDHDPLLFG